MRLLIISHTPHYRKGDVEVGWGSTIREIDQLGRVFDNIVHLAPLHPGVPPKSSLPYQSPNVHFHPVEAAGGNGLMDKLEILRQIPGWLAAMKSEMGIADTIHIRCPAAISTVALVAARLWAKGKPIWVKYGGSWEAYPNQPFSYKVQRWYLNENLHKGVVSINGHWDGQPDHVFSFLNPSFSELEYLKEKEIALKKQLSSPYQLLFVGNLSRAKGVDRVLEIADSLNKTGLDFSLTLVGDGSEREDFERFVKDRSLSDRVNFAGWQPMTSLHRYYKRAHLFLFPSTSEGWPKVLSEAMAHGVVPIASAIASIPEILEGAGAGLAIPPGDIEAFVDAVIMYTQDVKSWKKASMNGIGAASNFTYEYYLSSVKEMYRRAWSLDLNDE